VFHLLKQEWALLVLQSLLVSLAQGLVSLVVVAVVELQLVLPVVEVVWQQVLLALELVLLVGEVVAWQQVLLVLELEVSQQVF
jgi:hypothetical protein